MSSLPKWATAEAMVPEPCRILGTTLRPFCLGHHLLFKRLNLEVLEHAAAALPGIFICAGASYEATLNSLLRETWEPEFKAWSAQVKKLHKGRVGVMESAADAFLTYLADGYRLPPLLQWDGGVGLSAPWECALKCTLVKNGFSESEVLNGYLPGRRYDYYTLLDLRQFDIGVKPRLTFYTKEAAQA